MTISITEIENMKLADMRERKEELVEAAKAFDPVVLAKRYVQASIDAKVRDEKLGEQADTLEALQQGLESSKKLDGINAEKIKNQVHEIAGLKNDGVELSRAHDTRFNKAGAEAEQRYRKLKKDYDDFKHKVNASIEEAAELHLSQTATLNGELGTAQRRSARLKIQAEKFTAAVSGIHKLSMDAMQSQAIDDADNEGE